MSQATTFDGAAGTDERLLHVSRLQFVLCLAASVVLFLFVTGPLWRHASDVSVLDTAVWYSYGAIPLLIAGCLLASRRFSLRAFLLDTMALTLVKYVVTCSLAIVFWATVAPPKAAGVASPHRAVPAAPATPEPAIAPTPIDAARTGTVRATVVDGAGRPVAGALVYVAAGVEDFVFAAPEAPVVLEHGPRGVTPALAVAQVGQRIEARSSDGRMHTLVASRDGAALFNVPLLASGASTATRLRDAGGLLTLSCNAHPSEPRSLLLALAHPFYGWTDAEGHVTLSGVPAGRLRIGAVQADRAAGEAAVDLQAGEAGEVRIEIPVGA